MMSGTIINRIVSQCSLNKWRNSWKIQFDRISAASRIKILSRLSIIILQLQQLWTDKFSKNQHCMKYQTQPSVQMSMRIVLASDRKYQIQMQTNTIINSIEKRMYFIIQIPLYGSKDFFVVHKVRITTNKHIKIKGLSIYLQQHLPFWFKWWARSSPGCNIKNIM